MAKRPVLSKQAYLTQVKRTLATKRAQQVATNCANQLRKTCREVKDNKGAATRRLSTTSEHSCLSALRWLFSPQPL